MATWQFLVFFFYWRFGRNTTRPINKTNINISLKCILSTVNPVHPEKLRVSSGSLFFFLNLPVCLNESITWLQSSAVIWYLFSACVVMRNPYRSCLRLAFGTYKPLNAGWINIFRSERVPFTRFICMVHSTFSEFECLIILDSAANSSLFPLRYRTAVLYLHSTC